MVDLVRIDRIIIGIIWGLMVWPEVRDALMEQLFCNPIFQNDFSESIFFGLGYCTYAYVIFFIILPIITIVSYLPFILRFINWVNDRRT